MSDIAFNRRSPPCSLRVLIEDVAMFSRLGSAFGWAPFPFVFRENYKLLYERGT